MSKILPPFQHPLVNWVYRPERPDTPVLTTSGRIHVLFRGAVGPAHTDMCDRGILDVSVCGRFGLVGGAIRCIDGSDYTGGGPYNGLHMTYVSSVDSITGSKRMNAVSGDGGGSYVLLLKEEHWVPPLDFSGTDYNTPTALMARMADLAYPDGIFLVSPYDVIGFPFRSTRKWTLSDAAPWDVTQAAKASISAGHLSKATVALVSSDGRISKRVARAYLDALDRDKAYFDGLMANPKVHFVAHMGSRTKSNAMTRLYVRNCLIIPKVLLEPTLSSFSGAKWALFSAPEATVEVDLGPLYGGLQRIPAVWAEEYSEVREDITLEWSESQHALCHGVIGARSTPSGSYIKVGLTYVGGRVLDSWNDYTMSVPGDPIGNHVASPPTASNREWALSSVIAQVRDLPKGVCISAALSRPIHDAEGHPGQIGFYMTAQDIGRKVTWTRPGRYLARLAGGDDGFGGQQGLQKAALALDTDLKPPVLHLAVTQEDCVTVYRNGPSSCMSGTKAMVGDQHPACVYGGDADLTVAYIGDIKNAKGRCVVWPDKKKHGRIYGDVDRMQAALEGAGYEEDDSFYKATLNLVYVSDRSDRIMMPYWDGDRVVYIHGDVLRVGYGDVQVECGSTSGYVYASGRFTCDECGDSCDEDETTTVHNGDRVCEHCLDNHYSWVDSRAAYYPNDDVTYIEEINEHVLDTDSRLFTCEHTEEPSVGTPYAVIVDMEGNIQTWCEAAAERDASVADDGELVHVDIFDEYQASLNEDVEGVTPRCPETPDMFAEIAA